MDLFCIVAVFLPVCLVNSCNFSRSFFSRSLYYNSYFIRCLFNTFCVCFYCCIYGFGVVVSSNLVILNALAHVHHALSFCVYGKKGTQKHFINIIHFFLFRVYLHLCHLFLHFVFCFFWVYIYSFYFYSSNGKFYKWHWKTKTD